MVHPDHDQIKLLMHETAQRFILPKFKNLDEDDIETKSAPDDLVTIADHQAEAFLSANLKALYPSIAVLGEEAVAADPSILSILNDSSDETGYFVMDPVDGTRNFVAGKKEFGMILSYVRAGEVVQAYIYDVLQDHFMTAVKGEGAYDATHKITLQTQQDLRVGFGKDKYFCDDLRSKFNNAVLAHNLSSSVLGCSAHEYMQFVRGQARFYFACSAKPWDHLAGALITREAGGVCHNWNGSPYQPKDYNASILSAIDQDDWHYIHETLLQRRQTCRLG